VAMCENHALEAAIAVKDRSSSFCEAAHNKFN